MIIPIAIDLSEYDAIPEYKHDHTDFRTLVENLSEYPFLLLHDGDSITGSRFYRMISQIPQKNRDDFIRMCRKIPLRAVPNWDGVVEPTEQPSLNNAAHVVAMSKAKFHLTFNYDEAEDVAPHPIHDTLECASWKAIKHTRAFKELKQNTPIQIGNSRNQLWKERFEPLIGADKWKRIKLIDRYIFRGISLDFTKIDYILRKINQKLTHPTEIEIFVQTNVYKSYGSDFDDFPQICDHLQRTISSLSQINELRVYACNTYFGQHTLHDRFMFLTSTHDSLYTYEIGKGFNVLQSEHINEHTTFSLKIHYTITDEHNKIYREITSLTPNRTTKPDYPSDKVKIYIVG